MYRGGVVDYGKLGQTVEALNGIKTARCGLVGDCEPASQTRSSPSLSQWRDRCLLACFWCRVSLFAASSVKKVSNKANIKLTVSLNASISRRAGVESVARVI